MKFDELCRSFNSREQRPELAPSFLFESTWTDGAINDVIVRGLKGLGFNDWLSDKGDIWVLHFATWFKITHLIGEGESGTTLIRVFYV